jgi:hypothetical protein
MRSDIRTIDLPLVFGMLNMSLYASTDKVERFFRFLAARRNYYDTGKAISIAFMERYLTCKWNTL